MDRNYMTADELFRLTMERVAPLPCQECYAWNLAELFSYHLKKNLLMDEGVPPESLPSQSAMILAPSGQGKSFLLKEMAKIVDVHVIFIDGSSLSHEGWKGISLSQRLLAEKKGLRNNQKFQRSIIVIDEADKLRYWGTHHDQGGAQENLLQLFGGAPITAEDSQREAQTIDCKRMTILMAGAFAGLEDIVRKRLNQKATIGFCSQSSDIALCNAELFKLATHPDLVEYGMMNELMGRIGSIITIDPMEKEDYHKLLTASGNSICGRYRNYFLSLYGVDFEITDDGADAITRKCKASPTGARALTPLVNDLLRNAMTQVDQNDSICNVILDAKDGCTYIRYEMGERNEDSILIRSTTESENIPWMWKAKHYQLKAGSCSALACKLCLTYLEAEGNASDLGLVSAFLNCCIYYMKHRCNQEDFCLESLLKLAGTTKKTQIEEVSSFDLLMQDAILNNGERNILEDHYQLFCAIFTLPCTDLLLEALNIIQDKLMEESQNKKIWFEISDVD